MPGGGCGRFTDAALAGLSRGATTVITGSRCATTVTAGVTWMVIAAFFRYASLASLIAALFAALYAFWLFGLMHIPAVVLVMALLLVWRHRENIRRLAAGTESRLGRNSASPPPDPNAASR